MALVSIADAARYLDKERVGLRVVGELADLALEYYSNLPPAQHKPDRSLVSIADRNVELRARELLAQFDAAAAHETGFMGEEFGALNTLTGDLSSGSSTGFSSGPAAAPKGIWVLDPIDGTTCFLSRIPTWSVLLAYVENGLPQVGIVCFPALGEVFCASSGNGARYGVFGPEQRLGRRPPQACFVRGTKSLRDAFVSYSSPAQFAFRGLQDLWMKLGSACVDFRTVSDAFGYSRVLCGAIDGMIDIIAAPYDLAAVQVLFRETPGACFGAFYGEQAAAAFCSGGAVGVCSPEIFLEYRRLLAESLLEDPRDKETKFTGPSLAQWIGSEGLRGAFHRQQLRAYLSSEKAFAADLRVTVSVTQWCWLPGAGDLIHQDDGWFLDVAVDDGRSSEEEQTFRFSRSSQQPLHAEDQADDAERVFRELCTQAYASQVSEDRAAVPTKGFKDPMVSIESPAFTRQVAADELTWNRLRQELASSQWIRTGFLLVRHSVRMLDARGMDTYVVTMNLVAAPNSIAALGNGERPESVLQLASTSVLQEPLQVPPDASVTNWLKVIQAQYERLKD